MNSTTRLAGSALRAIVAATAGLLVFQACEPTDPLELARQRQAAGDYQGSLERLRDLIEERPKDPEVNYLYGAALAATDQPSLATWPLLQAMDDPDWLIPAGMQLAQAALVTGDFNEAVAATTRILDEHPDEVQALLYRAQANAHWKENPEAALRDADRVLELQPDMLEAYEPRILALLELDRHDEASESLAEAGRKLSTTETSKAVLAWHCSTTAIFQDEGGETDKARETYRECLEKYPANETVVLNAVKFYEAHGELDRSTEVLRAALAEAPNHRGFRSSLAERLRFAGKPEEGEALLLEATQAQEPTQQAAAWIDIAQYRTAMREYPAAAEAYERVVEISRKVDPEPNPQILFQYADALVLAKELDRAEKVAEDLSVPALRALIRARVAQERGQPAQAIASFDEALRVWPNNPYAHYYTALAAEQVGDFDRALEEYRYAIRISVGTTDARTRAARLLIAQGEPLMAYQLLFLEIGNDPLEPEGELLSMYLMARVANPRQIQSALLTLRARNPEKLPMALARSAEGAADLAGPGAALTLLSGAPGVDYTDPQFAPALRDLVRYAHAAGQPKKAERAVEAALKAHPDAAAFHAIRGLHRELSGAAAEAVRAAYARAVELDPNDAWALAGLGRATVASDPTEAVALFDRAAAADPTEPEYLLAGARAALSAGKAEPAERRLMLLLGKFPMEGEAAAELVALDLRRERVTQKTVDWARRAARFGGGVEAYEQLSQVYARLEQPKLAEEAAKRARILRDRQSEQESASEG
jgi:tetratricopeptide (TPR) repeat protein